MGNNSRKRFWVDRQIQGALAFRVAVHWCIFAGVATLLTIVMQYVANPFLEVGDHVGQIWQNQGVFGVVMLLMLPIFVYDTVKLSNRFAGPIVRMRRVMQAIAQGQPAERLEFRDGDFWRDMAADFNKLIDRGYFDAPPADANECVETVEEAEEVAV